MLMIAPTKDDVFQRLHDLTRYRTRKSAEKYAMVCPGPMSDPEDFVQDVYMRLYMWLDDPIHLEQADALLYNPVDAIKFLQQFARARICDHIDMNCAGPRDQRVTIHASQQSDHNVFKFRSGETLLDLLCHPTNIKPDPFDGLTAALVVEDIKTGLPALAKRLLDVLVDPPDDVRETFWESRIKISRGMATLAEPDGMYNETVLTLNCQEGYPIEDTSISWSGGVTAGDLDTTVGPARLEFVGAALVMQFESKLTVHLNRQSLEGMFIRESIRPSPRAFDVGVVADYLGVKMQPLRYAWNELRTALGIDFTSAALDVP